jgi:transcriptional regulator NrdR family protein
MNKAGHFHRNNPRDKIKVMDVKVVKRDGVIEDYDPNKIIRVAVAAGLDEQKAKIMSDEITIWVEKSGIKQFTSLQLRDIVTGKLHKFDEAAAKMYVWYQSTK